MKTCRWLIKLIGLGCLSCMNSCSTSSTCTYDTDCPGTKYCQNHQCVDLVCPGGCANGQYCSTSGCALCTQNEHCGADCVDCGPDKTCNDSGQCECQNQDCNGVCCASGQHCVEGVCNDCQPNCGLRQCGPDPQCHSSCGACAADQQCDDAGKCQCLDCDDGNPCTDDACDISSGCTHSVNSAGCSDGNGCTLGDHCADGACVSDATCQEQVDNKACMSNDHCGCYLDTDCRLGAMCEPNSNSCVPMHAASVWWANENGVRPRIDVTWEHQCGPCSCADDTAPSSWLEDIRVYNEDGTLIDPNYPYLMHWNHERGFEHYFGNDCSHWPGTYYRIHGTRADFQTADSCPAPGHVALPDRFMVMFWDRENDKPRSTFSNVFDLSTVPAGSLQACP